MGSKIFNSDVPNTEAQERGTEGDFVSMFTFGLIKPGGMPMSSDTDRVTSTPNLIGNALINVEAFNVVATTAGGIDYGGAPDPGPGPAPLNDATFTMTPGAPQA